MFTRWAVNATLHAQCDRFRWTIFPTRSLLVTLIRNEEIAIEERLTALSTGQSDPGRPDYYFGTEVRCIRIRPEGAINTETQNK